MTKADFNTDLTDFYSDDEPERACNKSACIFPHCDTCGWNPKVDAARRAKPIEWVENPDGTKSLKV